MSFDDSFHLRSQSQELHGPPQHPTASRSTTAASGVLFLILIYYILHYLDYTNLPLSELLWNTVVYVTPSRLISALDSGFEKSVSEEQDSTERGFESKCHASKSNAMRRILSLDGTGVMTVVQRTRTLSDLGSMFKAKSQYCLPGLGNWDHSCYQNSVLQGLASLECLPEFLQRFGSSGAPFFTKTALQDLTGKLNDPDNTGKTFWTPAELKSMSSWEQQDAQEYFSKVMDELDKDTAKCEKHKANSVGLETLAGRGATIVPSDQAKTMSETGKLVTSRLTSRTMLLPEELLSSLVRNPVEGLLAQRVGCQQCGYVEGLSLVPFNCLTVPLGKRGMYDVRECLDEYTALEPIHGVECTKCTLLRAKGQMEQILSRARSQKNVENAGKNSSSDALDVSAQQRLRLVNQALDENHYSDSVLKACQIPTFNRVLATKSRQAVIARAPKAVVIHINRSIFDELTGEQSKNQATVRFPRQFELGPWCLGHGTTHDNSETESWNVDPNESMLFRNNDMTSTDGKIYELRAVVTHFGRHENGHYICYRKTPYTAPEYEKSSREVQRNSRSWWRLSDEEVTEVSEENVLAQGGVFMLFYEQIPEANRKSEPLNTGAELVANLTNETSEPCAAEIATHDPDTQTLPARKGTEDYDLSSANAPAAPIPSEVLPVIPAEDAKPSGDEPPKPARTETAPTVPPPPPTNSPPPNTLSTTSENSPEPSDFLPKESQPSVTPLARTISPRTGTGSGKRAGKAMETVAGFVRAN